MKNTTKSSAKKTKRPAAKTVDSKVIRQRTWHDLKTATLITSGLANLFVLTGWALIQTTSQYNSQVISLLFP